MNWRNLVTCTDGKGFMQSPLFFGAFGAAVSGFVLHCLATGRISIDKHGSMVATRVQH